MQIQHDNVSISGSDEGVGLDGRRDVAFHSNGKTTHDGDRSLAGNSQFKPSSHLPKWARSMVASNFPVLNLWPRITSEELNRRAAGLQQAGVNTVVLFWMGEGRDYRHIVFDSSAFGAEEYDRVYKTLQMVTEACHRHQIRVIEHHGVAFIHTKVPGNSEKTEISSLYYKQWAMKNWLMCDLLSGEVSIGDYNAYSFCPNNPEFRDGVLDYLQDVMACGVDGLMPDDVLFSPDETYCGCSHCRKKFKTQTGNDLPDNQDDLNLFFRNLENPVYRAWIQFRQQSIGDFHQYLAEKLYARYGEIAYLTCACTDISPLGYIRTGMDAEQISRGSNIVHFEICNWYYHYYNWLRDAAEAKVKQAVARKNEQTTLTLFYPKNYAEADFVWALAKTWNHNLWFNWYRWCWQSSAGTPVQLKDAEPGLDVEHQVEALRHVTWDYENGPSLIKDYQTVHTLADVVVLYSRQSANAAGMDSQIYEREWLGWTESLISANIQMDVILDNDIRPELLNKYRLLILPNALALSDCQVQVLRTFANQGGFILYTCQTATRNETGARRATPILPMVIDRTEDEFTGWSDPQEEKSGAGRLYYISASFGCKTVYERVGAQSDDTVFANYPPHLSADWCDKVLALQMSEWVVNRLGGHQRIRISCDAPVHAMAYQSNDKIDVFLVNVQTASLPAGEVVTAYPPDLVAYSRKTPIRIQLKMNQPPSEVLVQEVGHPPQSWPFDFGAETGLEITLPPCSGVFQHCQIRGSQSC